MPLMPGVRPAPHIIRRERLIMRLPATHSPFTLRPYQAEAVDAILAAHRRGIRRQLIVLPTGAGKTEVFTHILHRLGLRTLVVAHRDELIDQAVEKIWRRAPVGTSVGVIKANREETGGQILVASIQTLGRSNRVAQLPRDIGLVIIDECHHAMGASYQRLLRDLGCLVPGGPLLLGFTATPDRADGQRIVGSIFDALVFSRNIPELIAQGYLSEIEARAIPIDVDLGSVRLLAGDLETRHLAYIFTQADVPARIVSAYLSNAGGLKAIAFAPGVKMAYELAHRFRQAGIPAEGIDGKSQRIQRRAALQRFHRGETMVLCNDSVLTEGFDEPSIGCVIMGRPTRSRPLYTQMVGRGLRPFPGKHHCLVLDLVGNAGRHDIAGIPDVFGLSGAMAVAS